MDKLVMYVDRNCNRYCVICQRNNVRRSIFLGTRFIRRVHDTKRITYWGVIPDQHFKGNEPIDNVF